MNNKKILYNLFENKFGKVKFIKEISNGGSARSYYRLGNDNIKVVGVVSDDIKENETFIKLDVSLKSSGIRVPAIIAADSAGNAYLLEDLGDISLLDVLFMDDKMKWAKKALDDLIKIQTLPENKWIASVGFPPFSERLVKWDLNYFKYDFLKPAAIYFDEERLEDDFEKLTLNLLKPEMITGLMYRDFQSRNIMIHDNQLWYIDFQGARKGPLLYDAVSFIWQAKAPFTFQEREELGEYYLNKLKEFAGFQENDISNQLDSFILFRTLQVLGAYGFRGLIERKRHFLDSLPKGIENLRYLKDKGKLDDYPELKRISEELYPEVFEKEQYQAGTLTLKVISFSYKKGYPEDKTGNGGGFMFDCRAIHNPGRYEEYKTLTGRDEKVISFLEKTEETGRFIDNAIKMVSPSIERYLKRGFTSLQVGFGCTGGQHRSVYCAESFARIIAEKYPDIKVILVHREQNFDK